MPGHPTGAVGGAERESRIPYCGRAQRDTSDNETTDVARESVASKVEATLIARELTSTSVSTAMVWEEATLLSSTATQVPSEAATCRVLGRSCNGR